MKRKSGWKTHEARRKNGLMPHLDVVPSEWDKVLSLLHVSEHDATALPEVKSWVRRNYLRRFVPESVLKTLKIGSFE